MLGNDLALIPIPPYEGYKKDSMDDKRDNRNRENEKDKGPFHLYSLVKSEGEIQRDKGN